MANRKNNNDAHKGASEEAALRRPRSLQLRIQGLSFREIAKRLSISHEQARQDVFHILSETITDEVREKASKLRELENERLDLLLLRWFPLAVQDEPDINAARLVERLIMRRAELNGLNMPIEVKHSGKIGIERKEEYKLVFETNKELKPSDRREILERLANIEINGKIA